MDEHVSMFIGIDGLPSSVINGTGGSSKRGEGKADLMRPAGSEEVRRFEKGKRLIAAAAADVPEQNGTSLACYATWRNSGNCDCRRVSRPGSRAWRGPGCSSPSLYVTDLHGLNGSAGLDYLILLCSQLSSLIRRII